LLIQAIHQNGVVVDVTDLATAKQKERIRILHVDDDSSLREIFKLILMDLDSSFEIDQACCVDEGLSKLAIGCYDVVVSDYEMPQKDGLQFLTELREQKNNIPFILFTGKGREEVAIKALNLGADGYHNKQGSPETVYGELAYGIRASFRRKNAEKLLKSSQEELKAIVLNAPLGIATSNSKMLFLSANEAFCRITGYSEDELQKRTFRDITYPEDVEVSSACMEELVSGRISFWSNEKRYVRKDGSIIYGKVTVSTIRDCEGRPVLFIAELEDITERKQAEAELRRTFEVLERVGEGIDAGLAVIGKDYRVVWANKRLMALGVAPNKKCYQTFNRSETICVDCGAKRIFEQTASIDVHEYETVNSKGETTWIELRVTPLKDKNGNVVAALELAVPITERKKTEQSLKASEAKYRKLFDESLDAIFVADVVTGIIVDCNAAASKLVGWEKFELVGQHQSIITLPDQIEDRFTRGFNLHLKDQTKTLETKIMKKTGEIRIVSVKATILEVNGKKLIQGTFRDITDLKKVNEQLFNMKEFDERIIDSLGDALLIIDPEDFTILNANKVAHEQLKLERKEIIGKTCYETTHLRSSPCKPPNHICPIREMKKTGKPVIVEHTHFDSQQNEVIVEVSAFPVKNEQGKTVVIHIAKDITQRKLTERELKVSEVKFRGITNSVRDAIILVDDQAKVTYWNPAAEKIFGYSNKEAIGKDVHQLVVPPTVSKIGREFIDIGVKAFTETGEGNFTIGNVELIGLRKDGNEFPAEMSLSPLNLGEKWNAVGVVKDITERVQAEQKIREAEKRYRTLFSQAPLGVVVIDPQTEKVVEFNDVAHIQLGYSREEFSKLCIPDFEAQKTVDEIDAHVKRILTTGKDEFETIHRTKNGEIRNVLVTVRAIELGNKPFLGCVFHDITDIRKIQNELMESETKFRQLVNVAQEGIWAFDNNYRTIFVNPQMTQMLGYAQHEMLGKSIFEFLEKKHIKKAEQILAHFKHGVKENFEYEFARKDDSRIYVNIAASEIRDDEGKASGTLAMVSDITYRKVLENKVANYSKHLKCMVDLRTVQLKDANERLVKSERLAAIGELAGMVGHDLRNPLAAIKNAVYYLKKKDTTISEAKAKEMLELIGKAIDHSDKIINDLLDYSREMHFELTKYTASSLVNNAIEMIQVPDRIKITNQVQEEVWIWVDADKITRVFINLIKNAIDAMPEKGTVKISSCKRRNRVEIAFADTGMGISEETLPKLFSPLFTTKAQGMGFGLAICKRLVEAHGGSITVKTAVNKGTTFTIALPTKPKVSSN